MQHATGGSSNGRTADSDSASLGSNPSPPAKPCGKPQDTFHSFRHAFKRQCRGVMDEKMRDLLTGNAGTASVGRMYGRGADLKTLAEAMAKVDYPSFPKLR